MKNFEWTIMIIAQEDNHNEWEYKVLLDSIKRQDWCEKIRYVIGNYNQLQFKGWIEISNRDQNSKYSIEEVPGSEVTGIFLDDANVLEIFFKYVLNDDSDHYALITWGHGAGLGFFHFVEEIPHKNDKLFNIELENFARTEKDFQNEYIRTIVGASISKPLNERSLPLFYSSFDFAALEDSVKTEIFKRHHLLTPEVLGEVIFNCFGKDKLIDFFIANSCYVQMIDVCLALYRNVDVYVASQTAVPFAGINYDELFTLIYKSVNEKKSLSETEVSENIIDYFPYKYILGNFGKTFKSHWGEFSLSEVALSAIHLKYAEKLFEVVDSVAKTILKVYNIPNFKNGILGMARTYCSDYPPGSGFIDFEKFLVELVKTFQLRENLIGGDNALIEAKEDFKAHLRELSKLKESDIALLALLTPSKLNMVDTQEMSTVSPLGFSIFYPGDNVIQDVKELSKNYFNESDKRAYSVKGSNWAKFISSI